MADLSKALPLTAHRLSSLPEFESRPGHVRMLPVFGVRQCFLPGNLVFSTIHNELLRMLPKYGRKSCDSKSNTIYMHCNVYLNRHHSAFI